MNASLMAAAIAAKKQQASEVLLKQLADAKAYGPAQAAPLTPGDAEQEQALAELVDSAVVRAWDGGYYLDRERQKEREQRQWWVALVILAVLASLTASAIALLNL